MKKFNLYKKAIGMMAFFVLVSCGSSTDEKENEGKDHVVISHVNVITMDGDEILMDHSIVISDGLIEDIVPADEYEGTGEIIDGKGKWLVPGLAEMHAHIPVPSDGDDSLVEETLFLYLSNGVTTIRGMLGNPYHLELRNRVIQGEVIGPRIYTSGPSLNGNSTPDPESAAKMVREQKEMGYDFLKLHPGLSDETFDEIDRVAEEVGITFSGHVSIDVGIRRALAGQYASIDHIDGYIEGLVPESLNLDPSSNGFFGINFTDVVDRALIDELVSMTKKRDVWVVPTQCLLERWAGPVDPEEIIIEPEMKYMSQGTRKNWLNRVKEFQSDESYDRERAGRFIELRREILKKLYDNEVGLLLGSDAPQIFNVPGFSIQHEMKSMVTAGISEYETLKMGTYNPAQFFGRTGDFGQIVIGASADLVMVNGNPLDDISNMRNPEGVMVRGLWLSGKEIAERLDRIAKKYSEQ